MTLIKAFIHKLAGGFLSQRTINVKKTFPSDEAIMYSFNPCTENRDRFIMIPDLLPLVHVVAMTACGASRDYKVGIMITLGCVWYVQSIRHTD